MFLFFKVQYRDRNRTLPKIFLAIKFGKLIPRKITSKFVHVQRKIGNYKINSNETCLSSDFETVSSKNDFFKKEGQVKNCNLFLNLALCSKV